jgi:hypothetical protein
MPTPATALPLETIGLDLHTREAQLCTPTAGGTVTERRIATTRAAFTAALGGRPPARVLLEASAESEWVARHLEGARARGGRRRPGLRADVRHPLAAGQDGQARRAHPPAGACRLGAYRPAHRLSDGQRHVRAEPAVRDALVRTRTRYVAVLETPVSGR